LDYRYFHPINKKRNTLAFRITASYILPSKDAAIPFYERFFMGGDFDIRGFDFRAVSPIASFTRQVDVTDSATGLTVKKPYDDIVYVGGDTETVANFEYRIPLFGPVTLAPFLDIDNT
jgi:outer membrane protein insertion porin family